MKVRNCFSLILVILILVGCSGKTGEGDTNGMEGGNRIAGESPEQAPPILRIAEQYGLAYAPLQLLRREGWLEEELPGIEVEWIRLSNTAAIREAMLSGRLDVGFMGIPPFLIGADRGMSWRIFTGLNRAPVGLVTWREDVHSLEDFDPRDRIALPQPGSIQHILLAMAAQKVLGDAKAFDNRLVTLNHPDGMNALLTRKDVAGHFTSPPFIMKELAQEGMHLVIEGTEAMGAPYTFIVGSVLEDFYRENSLVMTGLNRALERAFNLLRENPGEAAALLASEYDLPEEELLGYITWEGMAYGPEILGLPEFIDFMTGEEYLTKTRNAEDYLTSGMAP